MTAPHTPPSAQDSSTVLPCSSGCGGSGKRLLNLADGWCFAGCIEDPPCMNTHA